MRQKVKDILSFLADDERLREARKAARKTRDKYVGFSSDEMQNKYSECPLIGMHNYTMHIHTYTCNHVHM